MKTAWNSKVRKREVKSGHKILFLEIPTRRPVDWSAHRKSPYCDLLRIIASNSPIHFQKRCRNSINHNNLKQTAISNNERPMNLKNPYAVCPIKAYLSPPSAWYCLTIFFEISTVYILKNGRTSAAIGLQTKSLGRGWIIGSTKRRASDGKADPAGLCPTVSGKRIPAHDHAADFQGGAGLLRQLAMRYEFSPEGLVPQG